MNLTMNSRWSMVDQHTYLIVTISADNSEATASQTYLDIQLPEGARMRHIGTLPTDGHGNSIGVDVPDISSSNHQHIVFKVKSGRSSETEITPELHLHWIDSITGDLLERHQTGTPMPTEPADFDGDLAEIVAAAKSTHKPTHHRGHRAQPQESESMTTEHTRHNRRREYREAFMAGREFGRRGRHTARHGQDTMSPRKRAVMLQIDEMRERIDEMEQRIARMQGKTSFREMPGNTRFEERETHREITRTRREGRAGKSHHGHRCDHHMGGEGRKMGRMMRRAASSHYARDEGQLDA